MHHLEIVAPPVVTQSGTLASGSAVVAGLTTSALAGACGVSGAGIPAGTYVLSVDSASQVTLSADATATGANDLTFALEPITVPEAKAHLRVEVADDDALVMALIAAARQLAEAMARRTFLATTYDYFLDCFPEAGGGYFNRNVRQLGEGPGWLPSGGEAVIRLPKPPLVSVASVKYHDTTGALATIDPSAYFVSTGYGSRVQPVIGQVWPVTRQQIDSVVVRYSAGVANASSLEENVKAAVKLLVGHLYENREASTTAAIGMKEIPMGVEALLGAGEGWSYA